MRVLVAGLIVAAFGGLVHAADNKELIVGTWEIKYTDAKEIPVGTKLEFTAGGKFNLTLNANGKELTVNGGSYKIEKDVITLTGPDGMKSNDKGRLALVTKNSLVINDEKEDKVMVLKRVVK